MPHKVVQLTEDGNLYAGLEYSWFERAKAKLTGKELGELGAPTFVTSIEDALSAYSSGYKKPRTLSNYDAYKRVPVLRRSINATGYFTVRRGYDLVIEGIEGEPRDKFVQYLLRQNSRVNLDEVGYLSVIKKHVWGRAGWEIVWGRGKEVHKLQQLHSHKLSPEVDPKTLDIKMYRYGTVEYEPDDLLYLVQDPIMNPKGLATIDSLRVHCDAKLEFEFDLLQAAKRHWAPTGVYELDTSGIQDPNKRQERVDAFRKQIQPGRSIVTNQKVTANVIKLTPDLQGIIRSIERQDEEIMGTFQIPKAILARERTLTRATLEFSLKALYEGPIAFEQLQLKRDFEEQWYAQLTKRYWGENKAKNIKVHHKWRPYNTLDPTLIRSLAYAVGQGAMTRAEFFHILGIEMIDPAEIVPPNPRQQGPTDSEELAEKINELDSKVSTLIETS